MRRSISGYSRFLLFSFSLSWLALYGGLPMIDADLLLVLAVDARDVLLAHATEQVAEMLVLLRLSAAVLSSVSTKQKLGYSSYRR